MARTARAGGGSAVGEAGTTMPSSRTGLGATVGAGPVELLLRSQAPGQLAHRLKQFLEHLPVGLFIADSHGSPVYRNRAGMELIWPVQPTPPRGYMVPYRLYRAGTDTPYPGAEFPVTRALAGEASVVDDLEVEHPHDGEPGRAR